MISNKPALPVARGTLKSAELLKGARQIVILHDGQEYRLQLTKNGKLILTK
jgi:hemin uptake protein HemP